MSFAIGDIVRYHPIIGEGHDGRLYTVRDIGALGHGEIVAWLNGKPGCVALKALSHVEGGERGTSKR